MPALVVVAALILAFSSPARSLTVRIAGMPTRMTTDKCLFLIHARITGGGTQRTCLTTIDGFPGPGATMRSNGFMTFVLRAGTIRTRVSIMQRFAEDGIHANQLLRGSIVGGTRSYRRVHGTIKGSGTLVDRRAGLGPVNLRYTLSLR